MEKLFESKKLYNPTDTIPRTPDAKIIFTKAPFIQYEQILLDKSFRQYQKTIMVFKKFCKKHPCKKHVK